MVIPSKVKVAKTEEGRRLRGETKYSVWIPNTALAKHTMLSLSNELLTADKAVAAAWWAGLGDEEQAGWLKAEGVSSPAEAWAKFRREPRTPRHRRDGDNAAKTEEGRRLRGETKYSVWIPNTALARQRAFAVAGELLAADEADAAAWWAGLGDEERAGWLKADGVSSAAEAWAVFRQDPQAPRHRRGAAVVAKTGPLPKSLLFPVLSPEESNLVRRRMSKLCNDTQARLFFGVHDGDQPLTHRAVLLKGREIFGWLLRVYGRHSVGAARVSVFMDVLFPAPTFLAHVAALGKPYLFNPSRSDSFHALSVSMESDDDEVPDAMTWSAEECEDLVQAVGMVELFELDRRIELRSVGVLAPDATGTWKPLRRAWVEHEALAELKPTQAWWTLPAQTRTVSINAPEIACERRPYVEVQARFLDTTPGILFRTEAAALDFIGGRAYKFEFSAALPNGGGKVAVEVERSFTEDLAWRISICGDAGRLIGYQSYSFVDGRRALTVAIDAVRQGGKLPLTVDVSDDENGLERAAWAEHVRRTQEEHRRLRFVVDALTASQQPVASAVVNEVPK